MRIDTIFTSIEDKKVIVHRRDAKDAKEFNFLNSHER